MVDAAKNESKLEELSQLVLQSIRDIRPNIDFSQVLLLGVDAVEPFMNHWSALERRVCSAKLAIIRDEFRTRFPQFLENTENFTFGISDPAAEQYEHLLAPRNEDDLFQVAAAIIQDTFGEERKRIIGMSHFLSNLTGALQNYSRTTEAEILPIARAISQDT